MRLGLAIVAGVAWLVTLPMAAAALLNTEESWAMTAFVPAALLTAGAWWRHMKERERRIGLAGTMAGWLFIGALGLLGVSGFLWVLVAMALVASAMAYGVVLLVTQARAASPRRELTTGLALFATAGAASMFTITTGLPQTEAWWMPAHWILALGLGVATIASGLPSGDVQAAGAAPASTRGR